MADAQEPQRQSIQDRIAALNVGHVGRAPITATQNKRPPPPRPPVERSKSSHVPTTLDQEIGNEPIQSEAQQSKTVLPPPPGIVRTGQQVNGNKAKPPPPPRAPPRAATSGPSPALPPRRPSEHMGRRSSQESISSTVSSVSTLSTRTNSTATRTPSIDTGRIRAPAYDPAALPPLPPKKTKEEKEAALRPSFKGRQSSTSKSPISAKSSSTPPILPQRTASESEAKQTDHPRPPPRKLPPTTIPPVTPRAGGPPPVPSYRPVTSHGLPTPETTPEPTPPPIPASTRPDISRIMANKPKLSSPATSATVSSSVSMDRCLICRDFSAVDAHAARFPRAQVPSLDWLASQLCGPFPSHTDKARAIFTWCHHNIAYNVRDFFAGTVKHTTPADTLRTGEAVCAGYAGLFAAVANMSGVECIVVSGHGKGIGHTDTGPGQACPPRNPTGHAWNAVRIDHGEWKLVDPCWGAGAVDGAKKTYIPTFKPQEFTKSNDDFGLRHFPSNPDHFYRNDGRYQISWEEYILGPVPGIIGPGFCTQHKDENFRPGTVQPAHKFISTNPADHPGPTVRFMLERGCAHWDQRKNKEPGHLFAVTMKRPDGYHDYFCLDTNGKHLWADVPISKLPPKDYVRIVAITEVGGEDARGMTKSDWESKGRRGCAWSAVVTWETN